jgi:hypothetical protein
MRPDLSRVERQRFLKKYYRCFQPTRIFILLQNFAAARRAKQ